MAGWYAWQQYRVGGPDDGIAGGNGRIEFGLLLMLFLLPLHMLSGGPTPRSSSRFS